MTRHSSGVERMPIPASINHLLDPPIDVKLQLLQHHAELARLLAREILDEEVEALVGKRYSRDHPTGECYCRWGQNPGSVRISGERVPIDVPRVRDVEAGEERPLESYRSMKQADPGKKLTESILLRLAQGDYQRVARQFVDGFGLSQSSVGRRFDVQEFLHVERAEKALREFESRSLEEDNFLALWIDGKHVAGEQMIVCIGATEVGHKKVLGFTLATAENARPIIEMLRDLIQRGLTFEEGILCVIDGAKGLRKASAKSSGPALKSSGASGTNARTWSDTCRRPTNPHGARSCSELVAQKFLRMSRLMKRPKGDSSGSTRNWSRSTGGLPARCARV